MVSKALRPLLAAVAILAAAAGAAASGTASGDRPASTPLPAPSGFRAELLDTAAQPAAGRPTWTTAWTLSWNPVPGAVRYEITAVGPEGEGSAPMRRTTEPTLTLSVASGAGQLPTSAAVRDAQIAYRSTQLGVRVTAVAADGVVGLPSRVLPVGQPPAG